MWDSVSYELFGDDRGRMLAALMNANPDWLGAYEFPEGARLAVPDAPDGDAPAGLPPWKRGAADG
jgi:hypothetical protein